MYVVYEQLRRRRWSIWTTVVVVNKPRYVHLDFLCILCNGTRVLAVDVATLRECALVSDK